MTKDLADSSKEQVPLSDVGVVHEFEHFDQEEFGVANGAVTEANTCSLTYLAVLTFKSFLHDVQKHLFTGHVTADANLANTQCTPHLIFWVGVLSHLKELSFETCKLGVVDTHNSEALRHSAAL